MVANNPARDIKDFLTEYRNRLYGAALRRVPKGASGTLARSHHRLGPFKQGPYRFVTRVSNTAIYAKTIHDGRPMLTQADLKNARHWALPSRGDPSVLAGPRGMARMTPAVIRNPLGSRGRGNARVVSMIASTGQHVGHWIDLHDTLAAVKAQPWLEDAGDEANAWSRSVRRT
jgi:hypothetical protein